MYDKEGAETSKAHDDSQVTPVPTDEQGFLTDTAWETVRESLGTGDKRVILVTKPVTLNEIHRLATRKVST